MLEIKANQRTWAALLKDIKEGANAIRIYEELARPRMKKAGQMENSLEPRSSRSSSYKSMQPV